MCGLAGVVQGHSGPRATEHDLRKMCNFIAHRGPDGDGFYVDTDVMLGHRRLAVIDLHTGQQPMRDSQQRVTLVYNGEVYNYRDLREQLQSRGAQFNTASDTEVILQSYLEYGIECPKYLEGMFAFALWDHAKKRLLLARDAFGVKPLFFSNQPGGFVFGSELKAVLASGLIERRWDLQAMDDYFAYGCIRAPRSIYQSVEKVLPGYRVIVDKNDTGFEVTHEPYWTLPSADLSIAKMDERTALDELDRLVRSSVAKQMVSDVPIGTFLSGGLDSSLVTAAMVGASGSKVKAFSIGFNDAEHDESEVARTVANHLGVEHHLEIVEPEGIAILPALAAAYDEPFGDPSAIPTWYLSQMARRNVTVCLSGDGGDELFGGYSRYQRFGGVGRSAFQLSGPISALALRVTRTESRTRRWFERHAAAPRLQYGYFRNNFSPAMRARLFSDDAATSIDFLESQDLFHLHPPPAGLDLLQAAQLADFQGYLPDDVLTKVDRVSMAHSLEVRVPLLDFDVLRFARSLPAHWKIHQGKTKVMLRRLLERYVPGEIFNRPKKGFSIPLRRWLAGEIADYTRDVVESDVFQKSPYFSGSYVRHLWSLHQSGRVDVSFALWQLVMFHAWHEHVWKQ